LSKRDRSKRANNSKGKTKKGKTEERKEPPNHDFVSKQGKDKQDSSSIEQKTGKAIATKEVEESKYTDEFEERAFKFYRRLQKQNWACHSYNKTTWRKALLDISKHPQGKYWKRILRIYERFGYKEGREKWNLPQICSTLQFRDRYDWLCESIVDRIEDIENTLSEEEV
jgi:phenylalanyl-tRNA synthetase alpha subunit